MADYDQDKDGCQHLLKTEDAISRVALCHSSTLRIPDAPTGMLYPMYGLGELPQAFCRRAAVKGCIHVLRMPIVSLLIDKDTGLYMGVKLGSGQDIFSKKLIIDPSIVIPQSLSSDNHEHSEQERSERVRKGKVARGICILKRSIVADKNDVRVVYPPRSLYPEQETAVRALQIGSNLAVCPSNTCVLYLSTPCEEASQGKMALNAAIKALCVLPDEVGCETCSSSQDSSCVVLNGEEDDKATLSDKTSPNSQHSCRLVKNNEEGGRPTLLWKALFVQEVVEYSLNSSGSIISTPSPDGDFSYSNLIDTALKLFQEIYPDAELFPEPNDDAIAPESIHASDSKDDIALSTEPSSVSAQ